MLLKEYENIHSKIVQLNNLIKDLKEKCAESDSRFTDLGQDSHAITLVNTVLNYDSHVLPKIRRVYTAISELKTQVSNYMIIHSPYT